MAGRRSEKCSWCGVQLVVPPEAQTIKCAVCQAVTRVRPNDPLAQALRGFVNKMSNNLNMTAAPVNNHNGPLFGTSGGYGYYPQPSGPPPPPPRPPLLAASAHGRKRAVLCGVSYHGRSYRLKGSVNDVKCMRYFLVEKMGFPIDSILTLTEDETDPFRIPTKQNMRMALQWLVQGCQAGDSLVFHFSGHGAQQRDDNMDEIDGYDETLCPVDYETEGMLVDDEINDTIVRPLPHGAKLHAIIDACYSGTVLDLPFVCRMNREGYYIWEDQRCPAAAYKGTSGGLALSLSACDDHQISVDTTAFSRNAPTGAMTYSFIQAVQNEPGLTYGRLLNAMRSAIREANTVVRLSGPIASLLNKVLRTEFSQEPQLSSSDKFDIYSNQFIL